MSGAKLGVRWLKFNLVGAIGFGVQFAALALFLYGFRLNYLLATSLAVETAVLHNFVWHEFYTWRDRTHLAHRGWACRLIRFNLTNGVLSIVGNVVIMGVLVGRLHLHPLVSNLLAIAACSLVNFAASHWLVFKSRERV